MAISETKKKMVIDNYFKSECDVNTSIKEAFTKGFELGLRKAHIPQQKYGKWIERESGTEDKKNGFETVIVCSNCDLPATTFYSENCERRTQIRTHFCPNCGIKMIASKIMKELHWIDNADSWICPICGFETGSPAKYEGCKCPKCGFQDDKDKQKSEG